MIKAGETTDFRLGLRQLDPEFDKFRKEDKAYKQKWFARTSKIGFGLAVTGTALYMGVGNLISQNAIVNKNYDKAKSYQEAYSNSIALGDVEFNRTNFEKYNKKYKAAKTISYISLPVAALSAGATYFLWKKYRKNPLQRPVYEGKNPFVMTPILEFSPGWSGVGLRCDF